MPSCQVNGARTQTVCKNSGWKSDSNFYSFVVAEMVPGFIIQSYFLTLNVRVPKTSISFKRQKWCRGLGGGHVQTTIMVKETWYGSGHAQ